MRRIEIPYYKSSLALYVNESNLKAVISSKQHEIEAEVGDEAAIIRESLRNPVSSPLLRELAAGKRKIVLITSDHTRSVPSRLTLPILLEEIRSGNPAADVTILVATGLHRPTTEDELRGMFGDSIVDSEKIVVNDAFATADFEHICDLPSGASFHVHRLAAECDLLIAEGFIEPHFFAGFSGGRKSVLPGICSKETVNENHSYKAIAHPKAIAGIMEGNPIHEDMLFAAKAVNLRFILNVALSADKKVIKAFSGDMQRAHEDGVAFIRELSQCEPVLGDIVVTGNGGYPLDQNLYQSVKAVSTAELCAKDHSVIVMCCSCVDGVGGECFEKIMTGGTPEEMMEKLSAIPPKETIPEQWNAQVYFKTLMRHKVILVSDYLDPKLIEAANMIPAKKLDEAMAKAYEIKGKQAEVVVIPDGVAVMIVENI